MRESRKLPKLADSGWNCIVCNATLYEDVGIPLDGGLELHVCRKCWESLPAVDRLRLANEWRTGRAIQDCAAAFRLLCVAACNSNSLSRLGGFGGEN